jgi:hypothetical protein
MPLFDEKRNLNDRRKRNIGPPAGSRDRRIKKERRQTAISEISFHEWTRYFLNFKKRVALKATQRQAAEAMKTAINQQGIESSVSENSGLADRRHGEE